MKKPDPTIPEEFIASLKTKPKAEATFMKFPPSHKRKVLGYIYEAKKPETQACRIEKTIQQLNDGWK